MKVLGQSTYPQTPLPKKDKKDVTALVEVYELYDQICSTHLSDTKKMELLTTTLWDSPHISYIIKSEIAYLGLFEWHSDSALMWILQYGEPDNVLHAYEKAQGKKNKDDFGENSTVINEDHIGHLALNKNLDWSILWRILSTYSTQSWNNTLIEHISPEVLTADVISNLFLISDGVQLDKKIIANRAREINGYDNALPDSWIERIYESHS